MSLNLNPEKALIFRIVHVDNVPWILDHDGLHCRNWPEQNPRYVNIGNPDLIDKRSRHRVPIAPGGTLSDYVPFYFTPFSIMMYNIKTGYGGIPRRENREIVIFVSSLHHLHDQGVPFLFTDQHAYAVGTDYFDHLDDLDKIDWSLLRSRNFKTDDSDPGKQVRYQAEALVCRHLPLRGLLGIGCHDAEVKERVHALIVTRNLHIDVKTTPSWYF
ncbi:MAG TPA: DUF4433 domain-containing protein [Chthoniobacter sp.]|jgi:hypothetical protein